MPLPARAVVRLDAARALAGSLKRENELADPTELSQLASVQEFGQRQQQLSDRAEHCLQGTLRDRKLLREVEKLLRNIELDSDLDLEEPGRGGSSSAGYSALQRPSGSVLPGGAMSARRATSARPCQPTSLRPGSTAPQHRPVSVPEVDSARRAQEGAAAMPAAGVEAVEAVVARRLAHCEALASQLQSVQHDAHRLDDRLDAVAAGNARLQQQVDAALHFSEEEIHEEIKLEIARHRREEGEEEGQGGEDGSRARAAAAALGQ